MTASTERQEVWQAFLVVVGTLLVTVVAAHACGCNLRQQVKTVEGLADLATCVLEHEGMKPEQIAIVCGIRSVPDVLAILTAHERAAAKRFGSAATCSDAGADAR